MKGMKIVTGTVVVAAAICMTGCVKAPFTPPMGVFTDIEAPLDLDYDVTKVKGTKVGESSSTCILGLVAVGDSSTQSAAQNGGLKTVNHADYEYKNILGVYQKTTVKVYGE